MSPEQNFIYFVRDSFRDAVNSSDYVALNCGMSNYLKRSTRKWLWFDMILEACQIRKKTTKKVVCLNMGRIKLA
jgi:hypothetical protein